MYTIENYRGNVRFESLYGEIRGFLRTAADSGINEHFHWGRFEWMMAHPMLDADMLRKNAVFRDAGGCIVGAALFDTSYDDRWYLPHTTDDEELLHCMIGYVTEMDSESVVIKANLCDRALCSLLVGLGMKKQYSEKVLQMDLSGDLSYRIPSGFRVSSPDEEINRRQWRMVIHRGFDNDGEPAVTSGDAAEAEKHLENPEYIKVFAVDHGEYVAHCGVWYDGGAAAYIEPVATVPEHRGKGLGKAVVYEAVSRARALGAKRAVVLSDQEFYFHIGMTVSSEIGTWAGDK